MFNTPSPLHSSMYKMFLGDQDIAQVTQLVFQDGLALKDTVSQPKNYLDFQNVT